MPENEGNKFPQFLAAICICIGAAGTGTVISWTSNISEELGSGKLNNVKLDLALAGSMMCLGAAFVCIPIGIMADKLGRKLTCLFTVIPFTLGWVLIIFTSSQSMLWAGRFFTGLAGGSFCIVAPLYTSEIAQNEIRGTLGTFLQLFITIGILYANVFGYLVNVKMFCILCAAVPITFAVCFVFQPETPVYLIKSGKKDAALAAYARLRGKDYDPTPEIEVIQAQQAKEIELQGQFMEVLKSKPGWKSSLICFSLMFYQQLSGINAVMFYSGDIFIDAGSTIKPAYCSIAIGVVQILATVVSSFCIDKLGRKLLLMVSAFVMAVSTLLLGAFFFLKEKNMADKETLTSIGFIPLISLILFIIAFSFGMGPIPWLASSELFPPAIMARMSSLAGLFNWCLAFCVTIGYGPIKDSIGGWLTFIVFGVVSATGVGFVLIVMPETKGKSFQEIQDELGA